MEEHADKHRKIMSWLELPHIQVQSRTLIIKIVVLEQEWGDDE